MDNRLYFLASYPKSGNTWVRALYSTYIAGKLELNVLPGSHGDTNNGFLQIVSPKVMSELEFSERMMLRGAQFFAMMDASPFDPIVVKTHYINGVFEGYPAIPPNATRGALYIVRDPRELAISYAHHMGQSIDEAIDSISDSSTALKENDQVKAVLGSWTDHVKSWVRLASDPLPYQVNVIRYEDMLLDPHWALHEILVGMGITPEPARIKLAVEACTFKNMQQREAKEGFFEQSNKNDKFFRSGKADTWRKVLTKDQVKRIETAHGETMQQLGYEV